VRGIRACLQDDVFGEIGITSYPLSEAARVHADIGGAPHNRLHRAGA
jgi:hypothetical protein